MKTKVSKQEANQVLKRRFRAKRITISLPGYPPVSGIVSRVMVDDLTDRDVIIMMNDRRYSVSLECLNECVKILN
jgi:hypothetical protein